MDLRARPSLPAAAFQRWLCVGGWPRATRKPSLALAALLGAAALPAAAAAQAPSPTGGTAPTTPAAPAAPAAPATPTAAASSVAPRPVVDAITCRTACLGIARAVPGSVVRISGEGMAGVSSVILLGGKGRRDDVTVAVTPVSPTAVDAVLPSRAHSGSARAVT